MARPMLAWLNSAVLLFLLETTAAQSQTTVETIIVTANKREQTLASVDGSVQVVSARQLQTAGVMQVADLEKAFPGLLIRNRGNRAYPGVSLRGMTSPNFYSPTVQLYLDGVPQDMAFITQQLVNVERVELLRGPQGTLYGGNAYAGVIHVVTRPPSEHAQARIGATLADKQRTGDLSVASALGAAGFYTDFSLRWHDESGRIDDTGSGDNAIDDSRSYAGRLRTGYVSRQSPLALQLSLGKEDLESHEEIYLHETRFSARQYDSSTQGPAGFLDREVESYAMKADYTIGNVSLNSITAVQHRTMERLLNNGLNYPETQHNHSQELRMSWPTEHSENLLGLYYENQDFERHDPGFVGYSGPSLNQVEKNTLALYGESRLQFNQALDLTAGLRWEQSDMTIDFRRDAPGNLIFDNSKTYYNLSPKLSLGWQHSDQHRFYISVSKGYKPGGFNHAVSSAGDATAFDPEESVSAELGWRANVSDQALKVHSALYWVNTRDKQLYVGPLGFQVLRNAGDANSYGLELDIVWQATQALTLNASAVLGRTTLDDAVDPVTFANYDGNHLPYTPDTQVKLTANYQVQQQWLPAKLHLYATTRYTSRMFFEESNTLSQRGHVLTDIAAQLALPNGIELRLFADNLTDKQYRTSSFMFGPGDVRSTTGKGRVIGISASVTF